MTHYLRFPDQATWETLATTLGFRTSISVEVTPESTDPDTGVLTPAITENRWTWNYYTHDWGIDDIGDIYNTDEVYGTDEEGLPILITPPTKKEGYHVNIIFVKGEIPDSLSPYSVIPLHPSRVFA